MVGAVPGVEHGDKGLQAPRLSAWLHRHRGCFIVYRIFEKIKGSGGRP